MSISIAIVSSGKLTVKQEQKILFYLRDDMNAQFVFSLKAFVQFRDIFVVRLMVRTTYPKLICSPLATYFASFIMSVQCKGPNSSHTGGALDVPNHMPHAT